MVYIHMGERERETDQTTDEHGEQNYRQWPVPRHQRAEQRYVLLLLGEVHTPL